MILVLYHFALELMRVGERSTWDDKSVVVVVEIYQGSRRASLSGRMMEVIKNDDTSDKGFGLVRDKVPVRTLKFGFRVGILLGEGGGVVGTRRGIATEENAGDDGRAHREK